MAMRVMRAMFRRSRSRPPGGEVAGSSIGRMLAPYIGELPLNPRLPAREAYTVLDETEAIRIYRNTLRDERCAAALDQRLNAAISTPWEVEPGGTMARDRRAAAAVAEQLAALEFDRICRQLLHGVWFGWAVGEAMWGRDARRVVLDDLVVRSPERFWWSPSGELLLRTWSQPTGEIVSGGKFVVLARPGDHGDLPYSPGLARWCFWPVWLKRHGLKFWSVALERFGAPTAKGVHPRTADAAERQRLLEMVQGLATGAGVIVPEDQDIELLATAQRAGGSGGMDFQAFVQYLDHAITTTILGQSSTTDQGPWRGTAEVQRDVRDETIAADARLLDSALNTTIVRWLTEWNFPGAATPRLRHDTAPADDLDARAKREEIVSRTTGLRPTAQHVQDVYGGGWEARPSPPPGGPPLPGTAPGGAPDPGAEGPGAELAADDGEDPIAALAERARRRLGPLVDDWADALGAGIAAAGSLDAAREWLDSLGDPAPDTDAFVTAMTPALAAADLAGRYDIDIGPVELALATASFEHTHLPFEEQIEFFRDKVDLGTASWTDIWQAGHDRAFVVAGAARDDLVADLRGAVTKAIEEGTTLATFRADFDTIVERHGWSYRGGRDWRTRVIYETNLWTSYAAGRHEQMRAITDRRPYWRYRHSHASEEPREKHLAWDGLVLRHDDPWWATHYPPNGWGCKCYVEALNDRDLARLGKSGPDEAPAVVMRTVEVGTQGPNPRTVRVPEGIDPGWAYAPGQSLIGGE